MLLYLRIVLFDPAVKIFKLFPIVFRFAYSKYILKYYWQGIFKNFSEVPPNGKGYNSDDWSITTYISTKKSLLNYFSDSRKVDLENLLKLVKQVSNTKKKIKIYDFGGGMGISYIYLKNNLPKDIDLEFHVTENKAVCDYGRMIFGNDPKIIFNHEIPVSTKDFDIVYTRDAMQYVDDYKAVLNILCSMSAKYFLATKLPADAVPSFVTAEVNVGQSSIPYRFFNENEFIDQVKSNGYSLLYNESEPFYYDINNFPAEYRIKKYVMLLFER